MQLTRLLSVLLVTAGCGDSVAPVPVANEGDVPAGTSDAANGSTGGDDVTDSTASSEGDSSSGGTSGDAQGSSSDGSDGSSSGTTADAASDGGVDGSGDASGGMATEDASSDGAVDDGTSQDASAEDVDGGVDGPDGGDASADELRVPECPGTIERCDSGRCNGGEPCVTCPEGQLCVEVDVSCGPVSGSTAQCVDDPCAGETLACSCAGFLCDDLNLTLSCTVYDQDHFLVGPDHNPFLACVGGGRCASPHTRIATPFGDMRIADLSVGDLVYSQQADRIEAVPLLKVARTPVTDHHVVRLELSDGSVLEISGPHPTADGRRLDELRLGDTIDGRVILERQFIPYAYSSTYDILPASSTGTYVAEGLWMGTTLR